MEKRPNRKSIRLSGDAYRQQRNAFFITITTHDRYQWFVVHPKISESLVNEMEHLCRQRGADLYAWVLMPDHLHVLIQDTDIVEWVRALKGRLTVVARQIEPGRKLWQRSFYDHGLRKEESLENVARYIWENPVRKGIVMTANEYRWFGGRMIPKSGRG